MKLTATRMIFWGWGQKNKAWNLPNGKQLVAVWTYFSIMFLPVGWGIQWHVLGENRSEDQIISYEEVKKLFPTDTPKVGVFSRYGLLIGMAVIFLVGLLSS